MSHDDDYYAADDMDDNVGFIPFNPRERDDDSDDTSLSANRKRQRKNNEEMKKLDKGYYKLKRTVNHKQVDIDIYTTNDMPGTMIRDAITGSRYNEYRVGTRNEHLFFKVAIATGELGDSGGLVFFDSPEQYERHFKGIYVVPQVIKEKWTNKCAEIRAVNNK
jgi:hypothetical protein